MVIFCARRIKIAVNIISVSTEEGIVHNLLKTKKTAVLAATVAAIAILGGCGEEPVTPGTSRITVNGKQMVPAVSSPAWGLAHVKVTSKHAISANVKVTGMDGTVAQIYIGAPGETGDGNAIVFLEKNANNSWKTEGAWTLSDEQYKNYAAGNLYISVASSAHPDGEVRGQVRPHHGENED